MRYEISDSWRISFSVSLAIPFATVVGALGRRPGTPVGDRILRLSCGSVRRSCYWAACGGVLGAVPAGIRARRGTAPSGGAVRAHGCRALSSLSLGLGAGGEVRPAT